MRVVAVLAVANERPYLGNCLSHLIENGIDFAVVNNDSGDGSADLIREPRFARHLAGYTWVPYTGAFVWEDILKEQERLLRGIDADWHLLLSPDEIMHSYVPGESLSSAIERLDGQGFDVINFDEFVFLPVDHEYVPDRPGPQPLHHYYFYEPRRPNQMRAWKKATNLSNIWGAGHLLTGGDLRLAPESFALRHYIFRNQAHAYDKYAQRIFAADELGRGWHYDRVDQIVANFNFPPIGELQSLAEPSDRNLDRDHPRKTHYWER